MGKIVKGVFIKIIRIIVGVVVLSISCYIILRTIVSFGSGYSWSTMDWNNDGKTTLFEFFESSEVGSRKINNNGIVCIEYYSYKDGLTIKIICP